MMRDIPSLYEGLGKLRILLIVLLVGSAIAQISLNKI